MSSPSPSAAHVLECTSVQPGTYYAALSRIKDTCTRFRLLAGENRDVAYAVVIELLLATRPQSVHSPMSPQYFVGSRDSGDH
jgi:hypothetical protein